MSCSLCLLNCLLPAPSTHTNRKRAKGMGPADYNRGAITSAGLIRCGCHGQDITMSEFEQHSNSQIHRPAEYIFIKSIDMSLKVCMGVDCCCCCCCCWDWWWWGRRGDVDYTCVLI
jgi:hypothetical protein